MIITVPECVGQLVKYLPTDELGVITSYNDSFVFVRYSPVNGATSAATKRTDLSYHTPALNLNSDVVEAEMVMHHKYAKYRKFKT